MQLFGFIDSLVLDEKISHHILVTDALTVMDKLHLMEYFPRIYGLHEAWVSPKFHEVAEKFQIYHNFE